MNIKIPIGFHKAVLHISLATIDLNTKNLLELYFKIDQNKYALNENDVLKKFGFSQSQLRKLLRNNILLDLNKTCTICGKSFLIPISGRNKILDTILTNKDPRDHYNYHLDDCPEQYKFYIEPSDYFSTEFCEICILSKKREVLDKMLIEKKNKEIANELEKKKQAIKHQENLVIIKPHIKTNKKIGTGLKQFDKILIGGLDFNSLHLFAGNSSATSFAFLVGLAYNLWDNGYSINFITHSKKVSDIKNHLFSYAAKIDFNELDNLDNISSNYSEKLTLLSESILNSNLQITSLDIPIIPYLEKLTYTDQQQIFLIDCIQEIRFMEKSLVPPLTRDEEFAESLKRMTGIINQKKITIIASSLTNRLRDNYQSYSRKEEIGRKPMLKDLRDSNYLEHYSKTISYIDHSWNPDGVDRKDPQLVLLKNGYTQTTSEAIPLSFDHKTGYYNEPEFYNSDFKHFL